jgi:F-type H+-transporting ATPase subunit b
MVPFIALFFCALYALTAFAEGAGHGNHEQITFLGDWLPRLINFAVIAVAVYFLARTPVRDFFKNRSVEIARAMQESQEARERAMTDLAEMERKIRDLEVEINKMIADAQARGEKDQSALQEEGKKMVQDIQHQVKQSIDVEVRKAKSSLATEAALLSLDLAEGSIKKNISSKDHTQIIKEYISNVGGKG